MDCNPWDAGFHFTPAEEKLMESSDFLRFGLSHTVGVALIVFGMLSAAWASTRPHWRRAVGGTLWWVTVLFSAHSYWVRRGTLTLANALPLHLCDLILMLSLLGLARVARGKPPGERLTELLYYWGFGLSIHALVTPDLRDEFPHWRYLEFFWGHGLIFWSLACVVTVQGFPWSGTAAARSWLYVNVYLVVVSLLNWCFGWNYGYLCQKPISGSFLDFMGPGPSTSWLQTC